MILWPILLYNHHIQHFDFHLNSQLWVLNICSSHQGTFPATFDAKTK